MNAPWMYDYFSSLSARLLPRDDDDLCLLGRMACSLRAAVLTIDKANKSVNEWSGLTCIVIYLPYCRKVWWKTTALAEGLTIFGCTFQGYKIGLTLIGFKLNAKTSIFSYSQNILANASYDPVTACLDLGTKRCTRRLVTICTTTDLWFCDCVTKEGIRGNSSITVLRCRKSMRVPSKILRFRALHHSSSTLQ